MICDSQYGFINSYDISLRMLMFVLGNCITRLLIIKATDIMRIGISSWLRTGCLYFFVIRTSLL
jgi:hypothetical protein